MMLGVAGLTLFAAGPAPADHHGLDPLPIGGIRSCLAQSEDPAPPPPSAAPPEPRMMPMREVNLPVILDGRPIGDVGVEVLGERVTIDAERFLSAVGNELTPDLVAAVRGRAVNGRLTPEQASTDALVVRYNPQLLQIEVDAPATARLVRNINLSTDLEREEQAQEERPAGFSAFVTPTVTGEYVWKRTPSTAKGFGPVTGQLEFGGRIGGYRGVGFLSRHSFTTSSQAPGFIREESFLVYDDVRRLLRVTAGDLIPQATSFQTSPLMAGVSVERFFGLQPERLFRPVGNSSFQLDRPSTVEVRINGIPQRELFLQPGRYNLRDLPLAQGSNLVDLVIRDETGRETIISDRNFFDYALLAPGITEFSAAVGVKSRFGNRAPNYSDDPVFTGFARRGFSETVTAGLDVQADRFGANGGASVLWASPIGVFRLQAAGSQRRRFGAGGAAELAYSITGGLGSNRLSRFNLDLRAEFRSSNFSTINDEPPPLIGPRVINQPTSALFNASAQAFLGRTTLNASASYSIGRGGRANTTTAFAGINYQLSPRWTAGAFGRYVDDGQRKDTGLIFQLTWRPSPSTDVRARYDTGEREAQLAFRKSSARTVNSVNYGADIRRNDRDDVAIGSADAFYVGNRFEAGIVHRAETSANLDGVRDHRTRATLATSLVFADGAFGIGRPVRESFAVVKRHPTLAGKRVRIDETERGYFASSGTFGPAVHVDLNTYSSRSLYYSVDDLPPGYDLGDGQFILRPPFNGGYKLTVGSGASFTAIGQVRQSGSGAPLPFVGGQFVPLGNGEAKPIPAFTNRNGRLVATGLKAGKYRLELATTPPLVREIEIGENAQPLVDIGLIEVTAP